MRRTSCSPISACVRMIRHSCSSSAPGLTRMRSGIATLPMSCSQPPRRQRRTTSSGRASAVGDRSRELRDLLGVPLGHALAHAGRERERLRQPDRLGLLGGEIERGQLAEEARAVAPEALGGVQRAVGLVDDQLVRPGGIGEHAADRDGHVEPARADDDRRPAHALRAASRRSATARARSCSAGREHDELLAAPARHAVVARARRCAGARRSRSGRRRRPGGRRCR